MLIYLVLLRKQINFVAKYRTNITLEAGKDDEKSVEVYKPHDDLTISLLKNIMYSVKEIAIEKGAQFFVVFLSGTGGHTVERFILKDVLAEIGIPLIDIYEKVMKPHPDHLSLFPFKKESGTLLRA